MMDVMHACDVVMVNARMMDVMCVRDVVTDYEPHAKGTDAWP